MPVHHPSAVNESKASTPSTAVTRRPTRNVHNTPLSLGVTGAAIGVADVKTRLHSQSFAGEFGCVASSQPTRSRRPFIMRVIANRLGENGMDENYFYCLQEPSLFSSHAGRRNT